MSAPPSEHPPRGAGTRLARVSQLEGQRPPAQRPTRHARPPRGPAAAPARPPGSTLQRRAARWRRDGPPGQARRRPPRPAGVRRPRGDPRPRALEAPPTAAPARDAPPDPLPRQADAPGAPAGARLAPHPRTCPVPHAPPLGAPAARPPPQPPQARARPAARPPPGYSIPASPGPLRSARAGSHPQPPLARGTPGPSSPRSSSGGGDGRRKAGGGDGEGGARRRGPAQGSQGHRVRPLIRCLCVCPRWTTSPGRPRGGAESRPAGAPRGSLGLRVPLPEGL